MLDKIIPNVVHDLCLFFLLSLIAESVTADSTRPQAAEPLRGLGIAPGLSLHLLLHLLLVVRTLIVIVGLLLAEWIHQALLAEDLSDHRHKTPIVNRPIVSIVISNPLKTSYLTGRLPSGRMGIGSHIPRQESFDSHSRSRRATHEGLAGRVPAGAALHL